MPKTPPTITVPLPTDPRVLALAAAIEREPRLAFAIVGEVWAWLAANSSDTTTVAADIGILDAIVSEAGIGKAMLEARLIGTADGQLVLPAELRQRQPPPASSDDPEERKRRLDAEKSKRYRERKKLEGKPARSRKPASPSRQLGFLAGHKVMLIEGPYGPFAQMYGAKPKLTVSDKEWVFDDVTLEDAAPLMLEKVKQVHLKEQTVWDASKRQVITPPYAALASEVNALTSGKHSADSGVESACVTAAGDASPCVTDASPARHQNVTKSSPDRHPQNDPKSNEGNHLRRGDASPFFGGDALSSISLSVSSSKEEDMQQGTAGRPPPSDAHRQRLAFAERVSPAIGTSVEDVLQLMELAPSELMKRLNLADIDPKTGEKRTRKPPVATESPVDNKTSNQARKNKRPVNRTPEPLGKVSAVTMPVSDDDSSNRQRQRDAADADFEQRRQEALRVLDAAG